MSKERAAPRRSAPVAAALVAAAIGTASFAQGVPVIDGNRAVENARTIAEMEADAALQARKAESRARLDEIKASQLAALQEILGASTIAPAGNTASVVAELEAGTEPGGAAAEVYPAEESSDAATKLFGDASGSVEQIIIDVAKETHSLPGVAAAGLSVVQWRCLLQALIWQESRFNASAKSPVGAYGLTQIMPGTARDLGIYPAYQTDPVMQARGGARYLAQMLNMFDGNVVHGLAAYNAGPGNVQRHGGVPPFAETRKYVQVIPAKYNEYLAKVGGVDALGTIEPALMANAELGLQGMAATGYGDSLELTTAAAAQRLKSILERVDTTGTHADAVSLNSYARAEVGRLMVLLVRARAADAKPVSAEQMAVATANAEEKGFFDLTMEDF